MSIAAKDNWDKCHRKYLLLSYTARNNRLKTNVRLVSTLQDTTEDWGKTNWTHPDKIETCLKSKQAQIPKTTQCSTCCLCSASENQLWSMFSFKLWINWHSPVLSLRRGGNSSISPIYANDRIQILITAGKSLHITAFYVLHQVLGMLKSLNSYFTI